MSALTAAEPLAPALPASDDDLLFAQLQQIEGKAEIVDGRIVQMSPASAWHHFVAGELYVALRSYVRRMKRGIAVTGWTIAVNELLPDDWTAPTIACI